MWNYEKRLQFPVNIKTTNAEIAKIIEARETYFLALRVPKKAMIPVTMIPHEVKIPNPEKFETAFPPLNPAKIGQQ